ncbi:ribonuclease H-like domain-containing protein [Tanacetum coccineum]
MDLVFDININLFMVSEPVFVIVSLHGYSYGEYDDGSDVDNVTLISKLDVSHPLHLHPNDSVALTVVSVKLKGTENYQVWSCVMLLALEGKNKTRFIDGSCRRSNTDEVLGRQWDRVDALVLGWILNSISDELFLGQIFSKRAKHVWYELKETYDKVDGSVTFSLHHKIHTLSQNGSSIADYYHKLNALWKQFDALIELPRCTCHAADDFKKHNQLMKLMQFLMGLDDTYMQIRSSILSRETLPDVRSAYAIISSEESHRIATGSVSGTSQRSQTSVFNVNASNRGNFQRSQTSTSFSRPSNNNRPNDNGNRRTAGGSTLVCENCGFNGHTIDRCFKIIGYPPDFGKKKAGQNFKGKNVSNNDVGSSSSSGFSDEQLSTLISLIKKIQLMEKVCRPIWQDLKAGKVLGTGRQFGGLYYFDGNQDQVLNVLRPNLLFENDKSDVMCETCQRAKQTREPFPLSDHVSTELGLNKEDFFNLDDSIDHSEIPYDDERSDLSPHRYGTPSSHSGSTSDTNNENEGGHSLGSDAAASKNDRSVNPEDNDDNIFEGNGPSILSQNDQNVSETHNLRRSSKTSVFPRNYNDFVVESKVKYGLEKYVNYAHLLKDNYCFTSVLNKSFEPKSFEEAAKHQPWINAMNSEMDALYRNNTWDLVELPKAKGFNQKEGIDFDETFSHAVKIVTIRCLINLVIQNDWTLYQMDVNNAFLYGDLNETVYMSLPPGYFPKDETRSKSDYSLFTKKFGDVFIALLVYSNISLSSEPKDDDPLLDNIIDYQKLIGKLIYLTTTRHDIAYTVSCLSQFMHSPLKSHLKTNLKVVRQDVLTQEEAEYRALASMTSEVI